jgi:hypothetical protein
MSEQHAWIDNLELSDETKAALRAQAELAEAERIVRARRSLFDQAQKKVPRDERSQFAQLQRTIRSSV